MGRRGEEEEERKNEMQFVSRDSSTLAPRDELRQPAPQKAHQLSLTQTFFASVKNRNDSNPPSRPTPLSFIPPNGTRRSRNSQQLIQTVPLSIAAATRCARWRSRVQIE